MFRFANAEYLYLIALIPALWILYVVASRNRRIRLECFAIYETLRHLMPDVSRARVRIKFFVYLVSLLFIILALARPQYGSKLREQKSMGVEMMLVVDLSNSMLAEDYEPSRAESTKHAISRLLTEMKQQRIGLISFAGDAQVELPITTDYRMAQAFVERLSPLTMPVQGTNIGKAVDLALLSYSQERSESRVMILITDGEDHDQGAIAAAQRAKAQGVKIYTIGIGTPEGAPISINDNFIVDENGDMVVSKLNEEMLQEIASITEGGYIRATKRSIGLQEISQAINAMEQSELSTTLYEEYNEQYQYLLAIALLLLFIEYAISESKNTLLKSIQRRLKTSSIFFSK
ncbi:MAG: VWA domain-containing protein [Rikenellaceae bacterium]